MNLFVPGNPVPQGSKKALLRKGTNVPIVIDSNRVGLADWRASVTAAAMRWKAEQSQPRFFGSVAVKLDFYLRRPGDHFMPVNTKRSEVTLRADAPDYCAQTPDLDKLVRAIFDALTDADVWNDDKQVVKLVTTKYYATDIQRPGVVITVAQWGNSHGNS